MAVAQSVDWSSEHLWSCWVHLLWCDGQGPLTCHKSRRSCALAVPEMAHGISRHTVRSSKVLPCWILLADAAASTGKYISIYFIWIVCQSQAASQVEWSLFVAWVPWLFLHMYHLKCCISRFTKKLYQYPQICRGSLRSPGWRKLTSLKQDRKKQKKLGRQGIYPRSGDLIYDVAWRHDAPKYVVCIKLGRSPCISIFMYSYVCFMYYQ